MSTDKKARAEENNDMEFSSYYDSLPMNVKRRVRALKKLQVEMMKIESKFHEEIHKMECKYAKMYEPLLDKREQITNGKYEPKDDECDFPEDEPMDDDTQKKSDPSMKGVPAFWLNVLKSVELVRITIQDHDEPVLEHLVDVKVKLSEKPTGFKLEFHFTPNEYFSNTVLTKEYELKCTVDEEYPLGFEGPEIESCKGCEIKWKDGKNVTIKASKKKGEKEEAVESFFNFFSPPELGEKKAGDEEDEEREEKELILQEDYKIAEYIRHTLVPCAVLHFTGEAGDDDDDDFEDDEEFDEDEEIDDADYKRLKEIAKEKGSKSKK